MQTGRRSVGKTDHQKMGERKEYATTIVLARHDQFVETSTSRNLDQHQCSLNRSAEMCI